MIRTLAAALLFSGAAMAGPRIAVTFDDLPAHGTLPPGMTRVQIAEEVIEALKAAGVSPAYGFVNGALIQGEPMSAAVLTLWHDSGNLLGNHTWSHPSLSKIGVEADTADLIKNEDLLARQAGNTDWHVFRYPFIDEGKDETDRIALRKVLAARGYRIATVTMGLNDWDYPAPYARCLAKHDSAAVAKLEEMYLQRAEEGFDYARAVSKEAYGRDIPYILLVHIGGFQAHMLPKLLASFKAKGATFISFDEAMKDPAYAGYADPGQSAPPQSMEAAMWHNLYNDKHTAPKMPDGRNAELDAICR